MCGFTIIKKRYEGLVNLDLIKHRGLESNTIETDSFLIDFHSLPISSNLSGLKQPLGDKKNKFVFNGEIFNFKELDSSANSDLDYLNRLMHSSRFDYLKIYNESLKWDGFWSIAIIDDNNIFMFTDPLGKKQLYFNHKGVCSEIKPLLINPVLKNEKLNYDASNFGTEKTCFFEVSRCLPDSLYRYNNILGTILLKERDYFSMVNKSDENLYHLLEDSILKRTENKIDGVSLLLSSGLDSNIVKYFLDKNKIKHECVSYQSEELGFINHNVDKLATVDVNLIGQIVKAYEYSLDYGSLIPNYFLFQTCSNHVVLTGDGSDELFGGYRRAKDNDTIKFDLFMELPFYHNIRIDRMSMIHTKEARSPFLSHSIVKYALGLSKPERTDKKILRDLFKDKLPDYCFREKTPLRLNNNKEYNKSLIQSTFNNLNF